VQKLRPAHIKLISHAWAEHGAFGPSMSPLHVSATLGVHCESGGGGGGGGVCTGCCDIIYAKMTLLLLLSSFHAVGIWFRSSSCGNG
jgi:hypothetical protein